MQNELGPLDEIRLLKDGAALRLTFAGGVVTLSAPSLWCECRSAEGVLRRLNNVLPPPGLTITALQPVGDYAVNIAFSDGEQRGIYPFSLLSDLAAKALPESLAAA